ncbi:HicB-like protein involved in pilus formation [Nocardioides albertanoniae]|uniref:HicB-like protein involved in pilus formation n=1 Tax=Nocardioides albertanoniae TaxID=1175486 RepID=A0A543A2H0_9ACTN|nr:toxin-antitoxin system HicB family antitoxin [Nocardioides albertanoniae]TQL66778.1 HicB-like protein involved in pilus formation [Nocardioides albertanoniae]
MDITPYIDSLRRDLLAAAEASGPEARETAERLGFALDPAVRLAIMEAVSQAASEITAELPAGNVDVRLQGRDLEFGVTLPAFEPTPPVAPAPPAPPSPPQPLEPETDDALSRVTLRIPESLKAKAEEAAADAGQSLNTWLVGAVRAATRESGVNVDVDLSAIPQIVSEAMGAFDPFRGSPRDRSDKRMTGWL